MIPPLPESLWLQCESFFSRSILSGDGNKEVVAPFHVIFPPLGFGGGGGGHVQSPQDVQHCLSFNVFLNQGEATSHSVIPHFPQGLCVDVF